MLAGPIHRVMPVRLLDHFRPGRQGQPVVDRYRPLVPPVREGLPPLPLCLILDRRQLLLHRVVPLVHHELHLRRGLTAGE